MKTYYSEAGHKQYNLNSYSDHSGIVIRYITISTVLQIKPCPILTCHHRGHLRKHSSKPLSHSNQPTAQPTSLPPPPPRPRLLLLNNPRPLPCRILKNTLRIPIINPSLNHPTIRLIHILLHLFIKHSCPDGIVRLPEMFLQDPDDLVHWDLGVVAQDDEPFEGVPAVGHGADLAGDDGHFGGGFGWDVWIMYALAIWDRDRWGLVLCGFFFFLDEVVMVENGLYLAIYEK